MSAAAQGDQPGNNATVEGVVIGTFQAVPDESVDGEDVKNEGNGQLYLFGTLPLGPGRWHLELRGSTTPRDNGVTSFYGEANDSVGETLNANGSGRIAATQLFYTLPAGGDLSVGLLDATAFLDPNEIADNEYTQFIGSAFVNNPSIEYPSFVLGADYQGEVSTNLGYRVFVSGTGGLEDGDDPTYDNVIHVGEDGKGAFTAGELLWSVGGLYGDVGVWRNGRDHRELDESGADSKDNYGAYTTFGGPLAGGQWVAWGGLANQDVSAAANFLGAAYTHPIANAILGAGLARTGASNELPASTDATLQAELYLRLQVVGNAYISPDLQYVENSGFDPDRDSLIAGARTGFEF